MEAANECEPSMMQKKIGTATLRLEIKEGCVLQKEVIAMEETEPQEIQNLFIGSSMECDYEEKSIVRTITKELQCSFCERLIKVVNDGMDYAGKIQYKPEAYKQKWQQITSQVREIAEQIRTKTDEESVKEIEQYQDKIQEMNDKVLNNGPEQIVMGAYEELNKALEEFNSRNTVKELEPQAEKEEAETDSFQSAKLTAEEGTVSTKTGERVGNIVVIDNVEFSDFEYLGGGEEAMAYKARMKMGGEEQDVVVRVKDRGGKTVDFEGQFLRRIAEEIPGLKGSHILNSQKNRVNDCSNCGSERSSYLTSPEADIRYLILVTNR